MVGQGGVPVCDIKRRTVGLLACSPPHWVRGGGGQLGTGRGGPTGRFRGRVQNPTTGRSKPYHRSFKTLPPVTGTVTGTGTGVQRG